MRQTTQYIILYRERQAKQIKCTKMLQSCNIKYKQRAIMYNSNNSFSSVTRFSYACSFSLTSLALCHLLLLFKCKKERFREKEREKNETNVQRESSQNIYVYVNVRCGVVSLHGINLYSYIFFVQRRQKAVFSFRLKYLWFSFKCFKLH